MGHLLAQFVAQVVLCAQHQHLRLNAQPLQLLHAGLRGFGLQFACCCQIGHVGQVYVQCPLRPQLPAQLSDGFEKGLALNVADGAANLCDDKVIPTLSLSSSGGAGGGFQHPSLYLVRNMRHHLDGLAQIVATTLALDDTQIDAARGDAVVASGLNASEPLVVSQVQVGLHTVCRYVALAVLVRVQRAWVNVDVGVELLDGDVVATRLQQFSQRGRDNAFAQ